jgi:hypothetical protein
LKKITFSPSAVTPEYLWIQALAFKCNSSISRGSYIIWMHYHPVKQV